MSFPQFKLLAGLFADFRKEVSNISKDKRVIDLFEGVFIIDTDLLSSVRSLGIKKLESVLNDYEKKVSSILSPGAGAGAGAGAKSDVVPSPSKGNGIL